MPPFFYSFFLLSYFLKMDILTKIREKAKSKLMKIVLPESDDVRTLIAARNVALSGVALPILIGKRNTILDIAKRNGIDISGIEIFDINDEAFLNGAKRVYLERMRSRGVSEYEAYEIVKKPLYAGSLMVSLNMADGIVCGANHTTADTVRAYIRCIGPKKGIKTVSSFFLMVLNDKSFGDEGVLLYSDCGVVVDPTAEQLAEIAICAKESYEFLVGKEARVALLSFSTKGSAKHPVLEKILKALEILKARREDMIVDGELQVDAALIPSIGAKKAPQSKVAGRANVLIFPDLNSGNIAYKITERIGKATALGPILQGLSKAANDLSRGCSADDIADVIAITAVQAQSMKEYS